MNKSLTIQTHPNNIKVEYIGDDIVKVHLHSDLALCIEFDNNVLLHSGGDFAISASGEINLISQGSPICIDSIGSKIHLNSREGKLIRNLDESIEHRKNMAEEEKRINHITTMQEMQTKTLKERVSYLENQVESLLKILQVKV
jgi:hypothetical protein